ncbi:hypothetical protein TA3x_003056 [Tundrisphaera sp. TA3]|uniref:hypothetical protein n=1 Tax=Tundrisphaera sp. TA3 TaxID=3435775 RepID=UPI003EBBC183
MSKSSRGIDALASGLAGAVALTAIHEVARRVVPDPPRMDVLGRRGLRRVMRAAGLTPPSEPEAQGIALVGDLATNGLAYSLVGLGPAGSAPARGAAIGAALGVGALVLPPVLGLGPSPSDLKPRTAWMTFAWYFAGGLVAGGVYRGLRAPRQ